MKTIVYLLVYFMWPILLLVLGVAVVLGIGASLASLLPLSLYQASLLTVLTAMVLVFISFLMSFLTRFPLGKYPGDDEDDWDDEEDDDEDDWGDDGSPLFLHPTVRRDEPKVGRNAPCPCGSGRKYKNCCGRTSAPACNNDDSLPF